MDDTDLRDFKVLIVDAIGYLSRIYSYADIAFIGGAVGKTGLHNTLEAAVFGVPIIIGKHHQKFPEAQDMIDRGGMVAVESVDDLQNQLGEWINELSVRASAGQHNAAYVEKNQGAVIQIANYLRI
jgi:3-deoxy-D-manno-octulosonic-acid transferase